MEKRSRDVLNFFLSRRSHMAKFLCDPVPNRQEIELIITAAARSPDHGKLEPWRFLVLEKSAMNRVCNAIKNHGYMNGVEEDKLIKNESLFRNSPLVIAVVFSPKDTIKIPIIEQKMSAGAVCLALLNTAHAMGWGANWLTGWMAYDRAFLSSTFKLRKGEFIAGFIHIGTPKVKPNERPRPKVDELVTWIRK